MRKSGVVGRRVGVAVVAVEVGAGALAVAVIVIVIVIAGIDDDGAAAVATLEKGKRGGKISRRRLVLAKLIRPKVCVNKGSHEYVSRP